MDVVGYFARDIAVLLALSLFTLRAMDESCISIPRVCYSFLSKVYGVLIAKDVSFACKTGIAHLSSTHLADRA